jgi:hypothetical protein
MWWRVFEVAEREVNTANPIKKLSLECNIPKLFSTNTSKFFLTRDQKYEDYELLFRSIFIFISLELLFLVLYVCFVSSKSTYCCVRFIYMYTVYAMLSPTYQWNKKIQQKNAYRFDMRDFTYRGVQYRFWNVLSKIHFH